MFVEQESWLNGLRLGSSRLRKPRPGCVGGSLESMTSMTCRLFPVAAGRRIGLCIVHVS